MFGEAVAIVRRSIEEIDAQLERAFTVSMAVPSSSCTKRSPSGAVPNPRTET
jgi:hypothetical protein